MEHTFQIYQSLGVTAKAVHACCKDRLERFHIEPTQYMILCCLWQQDRMRPTDIAITTHLNPATITGVLQRLERKKLTERSSNTLRQRSVFVRLTALGEALVQEIDGEMQALEKELTGHIPQEELTQYKKLLERLEEKARTGT